jgi:hypothetical protein
VATRDGATTVLLGALRDVTSTAADLVTAAVQALNGYLVEVAARAGSVHVRDSKSRERGMITVTADTFAALVASVKAGRMDLGSLGPLGQFDTGKGVGLTVWPPSLCQSGKADAGTEGGRGLHLVQELSARWGSFQWPGAQVVVRPILTAATRPGPG